VLGAELLGIDAASAASLDIAAVMTDTRHPSPSPALFVALRTASADGHAHAAAAAAAGAVAVLVERPLPTLSLPQLVVADTWIALGLLAADNLRRSTCRVVAITGSYGKTTTKDLIAAALRARRRVVASQASFNNELGVPLTMLEVDADTEVLVAEVGARNAGDIDRLARLLQPEVAVITAVGPVHLETFGDQDGVAREKGRLVSALGPTGVAVLNADDPRVRAMAGSAPRTLLVATASGAAPVAGPTAAPTDPQPEWQTDLHATDVTTDRDARSRGRVTTPWGEVSLESPLPGGHHLGNAMLALAVAGHLGVPIDAAAAAIARASTSGSRAVVHDVAGLRLIDDAYNASPPTMIGALTTLQAMHADGRHWAVLGLMAELGTDSVELHHSVGAHCAATVDRVVVVGAQASPIAAGALAAGMADAAVHTVGDVAEAVTFLQSELRPGDAVLFKASRVVGLDRAAAGLIELLAASGTVAPASGPDPDGGAAA